MAWLNLDTFCCIVGRMTKLATQDEVRTDVFRPDFAFIARKTLPYLWGLLAIVVLCILFGVTDGLVITILAGFLAFFGLLTEVLRIRAKRDIPLLTVGPEGVSFPVSRIDAIPWDRITRVYVRELHSRGNTITCLHFRFRKGTLRRWQFGALGLDRWEIITSVRTLFGKTSQILGGMDAMIESVERYHPVER